MSKVTDFLKVVVLPLVVRGLLIFGGVVIVGIATAIGFKEQACKLAEKYNADTFKVSCVETVPSVELGAK